MERCGGHVQQRQDAHGQDEDASKVHEPTSGQDVSTLVALAVPQRIRVVQLVVGLGTIGVGGVERQDELWYDLALFALDVSRYTYLVRD